MRSVNHGTNINIATEDTEDTEEIQKWAILHKKSPFQGNRLLNFDFLLLAY